ncbi:putative membrane protein [Clostridium bornimense]|uniref:Putative membrane protein n=1 Tax=Clostridium bornimense TaxID=1216932 RepID=W6SDH7_9CLOT|nr:DUF5057 domain-containing protein [Clostridium bornimense]CDM67710.1 putative membrane protein [Clostridium bornimense]
MTYIKSFLGKRKKIISIIVILTLFFTIVFSGVRYKAAINPLKESKDKLNILVINPGNDTKLTTPSGKVKTQYKGSERYVTANVTSVSMPQFIGQVDQLNGKYDAVVITRNTVSGKDSDYTNPATPYDMFDTSSSDDKTGIPIPEGFRNAYGEGTPDSYRIRNGIKTSDIYNGKTYVEYYSENDITNKRAKEILAMKDSGQLIVLDNAIFTGDLNETKLVSNFRDVSESNVLKLNNSDITVQNIVDKYFDDDVVKEENVKPEVAVEGMPSKVKSTSVESDRKINGKVTINTGNAVKDGDKVKVDLYLDFNGDTLFKGTDLVYSTYGIIENGFVTCDVVYEMTDSFVGQLDWKIEVSTLKDGYIPKEDVENNIRTKTYVTGNVVYTNYSNKKNIKVLQITPDNKTLLNIQTNERMQKYLSSNGSEFLNSYNISIDVKSVSDVNKIGKIDESYTMIIFGFADTYGGSSDLDENMVNKLKEFVQKGKSVMFTHDTMPINIESAGNINESVTGPKRLAQFFRDYIGQARYIDPMRNGEEKNIYATFVPIYNSKGEVEKFESQDTNIPHDEIKVHDALKSTLGNTEVYSCGYTTPILERVRRNNGFIIGGNKANQGRIENQPYKVINTAVNLLNKGSITSYPYDLSNKKSMPVAMTHNQWYQLNLEDEDVVPWYTLDPSQVANCNDAAIGNLGGKANDFNYYNARDYYYTYSKGNITYSGTGHASNFSDEELELFVNTIIKADRACNHAPVLNAQVYVNDEYKNIYQVDEIKREDDLDIRVIPNDIDIGDNITVTMTVEVRENDKSSWKQIDLLESSFKVKSGANVDYTISKDNYNGDNSKITEIQVIIKGKDDRDAEANCITKIFKITDPIEPPHEYNLIHGLFDDYSFDHPDEGDAIRQSISLVGGTYGTFGIKYQYKSSDDKFKIVVDSSITNINNVRAYKIVGSKLIEVKTIGLDIGSTIITGSINDSSVSKNDTILIKYTGLMPNYSGEGVVLNNTVSIDGADTSADAKITIVKQPDLY